MKGYDAIRAVDEASMIQELVDLHFIAVSNKEDHIPVGPIDARAATGVSVRSSGETHYVPVPKDFITLARGTDTGPTSSPSCSHGAPQPSLPHFSGRSSPS